MYFALFREDHLIIIKWRTKRRININSQSHSYENKDITEEYWYKKKQKKLAMPSINIQKASFWKKQPINKTQPAGVKIKPQEDNCE